jgi:DNA-binding beta-propeller fold protein YncE
MNRSPLPVHSPRSRRRAWVRRAAVVIVSVTGAGFGLAARPAPPLQAPVWPPPPDPARVRFVTSISSPRDIGATGSWLSRAAGVLVGRKRQPSVLRPRGLATDSSGRLLIADPDQRMVHVLDIAGRKYSYLEPAPFLSPVGVAVGTDQSIYVSDSGQRRIYRYRPDGRLRAALGVVNGEAVFARPTGLAVTPGGDLLVVDTLGCRVVELSPSGLIRHAFGRRGSGPGEFNYPTDITVSPKGQIFVVDSMNARIQVFDADGGLLGEFGTRGNGTGDFDKPKGVALDSDGHVYVAEAMHDVVQVFDTDGRLLLVIGRSGAEPGEFSLPSAVHIDAANRIFVADALNGRVQVFQYVSRPDSP